MNQKSGLISQTRLGNAPAVRALLQTGSSPDQLDGDGLSSLFWAACLGRPEIAGLLLAAGANPNIQRIDGGTPLHWAVRKGFQDIVLQLLEAGADPNLADKRGNTPVHEAAIHHRLEALEALKSRGGALDRPNGAGQTPAYCAELDDFHSAVMGGNLQSVRDALQKHPEFRDMPSQRSAGAIDDLRMGQPVHMACRSGQEACLGLLMEAGADLNSLDSNGMTPLHAAVAGNHPNIVKLLLSKEADINKGTELPPLHYACSENRSALIKLLLERSADPDIRDKAGRTAVFHSVMFGGKCKKALELLIAKGADLNVRDKDGHTPLFYAESYGKPVEAEIIRGHGGTRQ